MKIIMWIIAVYFFITIGFLFGFYVMIKFNKKVNEYWENRIAKLISEYPNLSTEAIEDVLAACLVRSCILWPKLLFRFFIGKIRKEN